MATSLVLREDILLGEDGDFPLEDNIVGGVYLPTPYGNSDFQHKIDLVFFTKGSLKQFPTEGFGIIQYQESEYDLDNVYSNLSITAENDGYKLKNGSVIPDADGGFGIDTNLIVNNY